MDGGPWSQVRLAVLFSLLLGGVQPSLAATCDREGRTNARTLATPHWCTHLDSAALGSP